jgi:hypothetical protein
MRSSNTEHSEKSLFLPPDQIRSKLTFSTGSTFVLTAADTGNNESADSARASYPYDLVAPAVPKSLAVTK